MKSKPKNIFNKKKMKSKILNFSISNDNNLDINNKAQ